MESVFLVRKVNEIKYKIFTDFLLNIHLILPLYLIIFISEVQKHFYVLINSQIIM